MDKFESAWYGKKILVVEDDEYSVLLIKEYLEIIGAIIVCAKTLAEALNIISSQKIDLVLVDVILSENECGFQITKQIKLLYPNLPVIIQTAKVLASDREEGFLSGCDDFITKPYFFDDFFNTLEKHSNRVTN